MQLVTLGTGTMVPTRNKKSSGYLVKNKGDFLLLDCGEGVFGRLLNLNIDYFKIHNIVISHTHTDHIGDFMPLIHAQFVEGLYHPKRKRRKPLNIIGPKRFKKSFELLRKVMWPEPNEYMPIKIYEQPKLLRKESFKIQTMPVEHTPWFNAIAMAVYGAKKKLVYSGDVYKSILNSKKFIDLCNNADLLIIDTGKPVGHFEGGHLNPYEAGLLATKCKVKHLVLTHLKEGKDKPSEVIKDCRKTYKGKLILAKDLLKINI